MESIKSEMVCLPSREKALIEALHTMTSNYEDISHKRSPQEATTIKCLKSLLTNISLYLSSDQSINKSNQSSPQTKIPNQVKKITDDQVSPNYYSISLQVLKNKEYLKRTEDNIGVGVPPHYTCRPIITTENNTMEGACQTLTKKQSQATLSTTEGACQTLTTEFV
ncbi:hypothetical protein J6590_053719 [Homalodisca vitripennis]|nr:hypothetical protein J6590_053719 [Homalodisca vitripennis]